MPRHSLKFGLFIELSSNLVILHGTHGHGQPFGGGGGGTRTGGGIGLGGGIGFGSCSSQTPGQSSTHSLRIISKL